MNYVLPCDGWRQRYRVRGQDRPTVAVYVCDGLRMILYMMPQNQ